MTLIEAIQTTTHELYKKPPIDLERDLRDRIAWLLHLHGAGYPDIAKTLGYYDGSGARKATMRGQRADFLHEQLNIVEARFQTELLSFGKTPR